MTNFTITKFSRSIIFAVFADWLQTAKIKLAKCFVVYACIRSVHPWSAKFSIFCETFSIFIKKEFNHLTAGMQVVEWWSSDEIA